MRPFALLFLAALFAAATMDAQTGCPAHVKGISFRSVNRHQIVVDVSINHSGPYDFLLDTGTQMTVVDRSLAGDLHMATTGGANVAGVSFQGEALFGQLDTLAVGDHATTNLGVLVYDMKNVQAQGFAIRGLLGEDFLSRFDVLIDNAHNVLCLDDTGALRGGTISGKLTTDH
jgi:gag-polyprotein putative aspartyl protease